MGSLRGRRVFDYWVVMFIESSFEFTEVVFNFGMGFRVLIFVMF